MFFSLFVALTQTLTRGLGTDTALHVLQKMYLRAEPSVAENISS